MCGKSICVEDRAVWARVAAVWAGGDPGGTGGVREAGLLEQVRDTVGTSSRWKQTTLLPSAFTCTVSPGPCMPQHALGCVKTHTTAAKADVPHWERAPRSVHPLTSTGRSRCKGPGGQGECPRGQHGRTAAGAGRHLILATTISAPLHRRGPRAPSSQAACPVTRPGKDGPARGPGCREPAASRSRWPPPSPPLPSFPGRATPPWPRVRRRQRSRAERVRGRSPMRKAPLPRVGVRDPGFWPRQGFCL